MLLSYRIPREPSTPRIAVWRKLKRLGVAQLGDGLIALPADARTREQLDWIAEDITDAGGAASIWLAHPASMRQECELTSGLAAARAAEYTEVLTEAQAARTLDAAARAAAIRRLRGQLRRIGRRDYFPPPERVAARAAVDALAEAEPATNESELS
ncbi:Chromate resistance protein ChrB [Streptomyces sp. NPDC053431]|uniref:Chromate resistance protein ChrB n=1 Tax=Streptomyces sp. NPDC053431 TaxID=3365703 RepID=UPI0037CDB41B